MDPKAGSYIARRVNIDIYILVVVLIILNIVCVLREQMARNIAVVQSTELVGIKSPHYQRDLNCISAYCSKYLPVSVYNVNNNNTSLLFLSQKLSSNK